MKLIIAIFFVAVASAGRLENTYLPPSSSKLAGSGVTILGVPSVGLDTPLPSFTQPSFRAPIATGVIGGIPSLSTSGSTGGYYAAPVSPPVPILRLNNDNNGDGSYKFEYETANHIAVQESGHLKSADINEVQGVFSYQAPDGQIVSVSYVADENGFRASGPHIPTPPPVPEAIQKSLETNAAEEARGIIDNGQYNPSAAEVAAERQFGVSSVSNQYLPPVTRQNGYRY